MGCKIYDFKFTAVVFEEDYSLLKQAVGEELGGVTDNESGAEVELAAAMVNSNLFMENISLPVTIKVDCEPGGGCAL